MLKSTSTRLEKLVRDEHSSLLRTLVNYGRKKFYNVDNWSSTGTRHFAAKEKRSGWRPRCVRLWRDSTRAGTSCPELEGAKMAKRS